MCGRSALTLDPPLYRKTVSRYVNRDNSTDTNQQQDTSSHPHNQHSTASDATTQMQWIDQEKYRPSYNTCPVTYVPIVLYNPEEQAFKIQSMRWGLIPHFLPEDSVKEWSAKMLNARIETLLEKNSFKKLIDKQRCVCFVEGFYEWETIQTQSKELKQPYFIKPKQEGELLAFACLYDVWKSKDGKELLHTFCVITTSPSKEYNFHDRFPIVLTNAQQIDEWLRVDKYNQEDALKMIHRPISEAISTVTWYKVSDFVSNMRNEGKKCIEPLESVMKKNSLHRFFKPSVKKEENSSKPTIKTEQQSNLKRPLVEVKKEEEDPIVKKEQVEEPAAKKIKLL